MTKLAYNLSEAATACGVSRDTIKRAIAAGALKAAKTSTDEAGDPVGRYVITAKSLEAWLDGLAAA